MCLFYRDKFYSPVNGYHLVYPLHDLARPGRILLLGDRSEQVNYAMLERIGEVLEWLNRHAWKACRGVSSLMGSNPILSATLARCLFLRP